MFVYYEKNIYAFDFYIQILCDLSFHKRNK